MYPRFRKMSAATALTSLDVLARTVTSGTPAELDGIFRAPPEDWQPVIASANAAPADAPTRKKPRILLIRYSGLAVPESLVSITRCNQVKFGFPIAPAIALTIGPGTLGSRTG